MRGGPGVYSRSSRKSECKCESVAPASRRRFGGRKMASLNGMDESSFIFDWRLLCLCLARAPQASAQAPPAYKVDASWPKQLPNNWIMGQVGGMAVDRQDHIWVLQRPGSNTKDDLGAAQNPPAAECCVSAPPVLVFDAEGNLLKSWGGPGSGYDWPTYGAQHLRRPRRKRVDYRQWRQRPAGLKFTSDGKFLLEIGHPSAAPMNNSDTSILGRPAGIELDERLTRFISPMDTSIGGSSCSILKREHSNECGAHYGKPPSDADLVPYNPADSPNPLFRNPVHSRAHLPGRARVCLRSSERQNSESSQRRESS